MTTFQPINAGLLATPKPKTPTATANSTPAYVSKPSTVDFSKLNLAASPQWSSISTGNSIDLSGFTNTVQPIALPNPVLPTPQPEPQFISYDQPTYQTQQQGNPQSSIDPTLGDPRQLQADIAALEERIASAGSDLTNAYQQNGIYDQIAQLNEMKKKLAGVQDAYNAAQDKQSQLETAGALIPDSVRKSLTGAQATQQDFANVAKPLLDQNNVDTIKAQADTLAQSRMYSRMGAAVGNMSDAINTNIKLVQDTVNAELSKNQALLENKSQRLQTIQKAYADIITTQQNTLIEEAKQNNAIQMQNVKDEADLKKSLLTKMIEGGVGGSELSRYAGMSSDEILAAMPSSSTNSIASFKDLTPDQVANLTPAQYAQYERYQKASAAVQAESDKKTALNMSMDKMLNSITNVLDNSNGMRVSVGPNGLTSDVILQLNQGDANTFRGDLKNLVAVLTSEQYSQMKKQGQTFGALTEAELALISNAAQSLGLITDENGIPTGRSNLPEKVFTQKISDIKAITNKLYILNNIGSEKYNAAGFRNASPELLDQTVKAIQQQGMNIMGGSQASGIINYPEPHLVSTLNFIKNQEGFSPKAYKDPTGTWTIGYGETMLNGRPVKAGDKLTQPQANTLLAQRVQNDYSSFLNYVKRPLTPNQTAALASFEYNLGSGIWQDPYANRILQNINKGNFAMAGQLMQPYVNSKGQKLPGLVTRRKQEAQLLLA